MVGFLMAIATRVASIITATSGTDTYEDTTVAETTAYTDVPVHFTERITTDPQGQSVKRAKIRMPANYVIETGNVVLIGSQRWSVVDVISQRTPQEWHIVNCVCLPA